MATDLHGLRDALDVELGAQNKSFTELDRLLKLGVNLYNAMAPKAFTVSSADVLDRDATEVEKRALVLWAVVVYLGQRSVQTSEEAITHSNVAGRVDLTAIEGALSRRRQELMDQQLLPLMQRVNGHAVIADVAVKELGETKDLT